MIPFQGVLVHERNDVLLVFLISYTSLALRPGAPLPGLVGETPFSSTAVMRGPEVPAVDKFLHPSAYVTQ